MTVGPSPTRDRTCERGGGKGPCAKRPERGLSFRPARAGPTRRRFASARGAKRKKAAPSGAHRQMRGTERVHSPAPLYPAPAPGEHVARIIESFISLVHLWRSATFGKFPMWGWRLVNRNRGEGRRKARELMCLAVMLSDQLADLGVRQLVQRTLPRPSDLRNHKRWRIVRIDIP